MSARESYVPAGRFRLFCRDVGDGHPAVVVHGGPSLDHAYLLPELDRLAASFHLLYYDQRGRGRSGAGVRPEDVSLESELDDLERVRSHFGAESVAVVGHSWGGLLALEYAVRHAARVSRLILLDTAPVSAEGWRLLLEAFDARPLGDLEEMTAISSTAAYERGDPEADAAHLRAYFRMTVRRPELLEALVARLRQNVTEDGVLLARAVGEGLIGESVGSAGYDLLPALRGLEVPTLMLHGEHDFIPVDLVAPIADAIPGARLSVLPGCGHFTFLEEPELVVEEILRAIAEADDADPHLDGPAGFELALRGRPLA